MFVLNEKKRMAAGEKIKSDSHCGERTYTRVYGQSEIGFGIVNWKPKKVWSLSFPEWFRIFVPKENVSTGNKLIFYFQETFSDPGHVSQLRKL